jgi:peptidoglycan/LPS O-acetylase OafA/YrhL
MLFFRHSSITGFVGYSLFLGDVVNVTRYSIAPLIGLWSLAIEEHFYIVWPFVTRFMRVRGMTICLITILCIEPIARVLAGVLHVPFETIYYLTVFRLDGLAAGALLAIVEVTGTRTPIIRKAVGTVAATAAALLIVLTYALPSFTRTANSVLFNGFGYSLVTCAASAAVAHVLWQERSLFSRILSIPIIVFIGRISYGMYLYHFVVLSLARHLLGVPAGAQGTAVTRLLVAPDILITVGVSYISYRLCEQPVMEWGKRKLKSGRTESGVHMEPKTANAA